MYFSKYSDVEIDPLSLPPATAPKPRRGMQGKSLPLSPQEAIRECGHLLTMFEKKEILEYPEIWFVGGESKKIEGIPGSSQNSGYDDDNGSYIKVLHDHISYRYEIKEIIGKGSFGQVIKVRGKVTFVVNALIFMVKFTD